MKVRVLGCSGGATPTTMTTSFLIDDSLLIDAGAVCANLKLQDQRKLDYALVTHTHLDHIKDLAFLADNIVGVRQSPLTVYGSQGTIDGLKKHFFNDIIWPDFTKIPTTEMPIIQLKTISTNGEPVDVGGYQVRATLVNHIHGATGYVVRKGKSAILVSGDTCATTRLWELAHETPGLQAIFTEISFPSTMQELAEISKHFCPMTFEQELEKLRGLDVPVYVAHFKPGLEEVLKRELRTRSMASKGVRVLRQGETFKF